jgi:hypothetical protein
MQVGGFIRGLVEQRADERSEVQLEDCYQIMYSP